MLIACTDLRQCEMDILIGLVIAMFIVTAGYVGYHASQAPVEDIGAHSISKSETLGQDTPIPELARASVLRSTTS